MTLAGPDAADLAAVKEAAALDAAGRHTDAINVLSRAAAAGNSTAKRIVGMRTMIGDRAPYLGAQGAGLIADAAHEGDPDAAALCAALAGAGIYQPQSWAEALTWLETAAEQGHTGARGQLRMLASADDNADDWRALRRAVDIEHLLQAPEPHALSQDPRILVYPGFADDRLCAWLIQRARGRLRRALVYDSERMSDKADSWRTNTSALFTLADCDLAQVILQARIARAAALPFAHLEAASVLHYEPGQAFDDHYDFVDPQSANYAAEIARRGERLVTFLVYLNDDYVGGDTAFPRLGLSHHGARGEGLLFVNAPAEGRPDVRMLHAGRSPESGEKWVVSQWLRSRPIAPGISPAWRP